MELLRHFALAAFPALGMSAVLTVLVIRYWPLSLGFDAGNMGRKAQAYPILRLGGLAIVLGMILPVLLLQKGVAHGDGISGVWMLLSCCALMFFIGFVDDIKPLPASVKLAAQIAVATIAYLLGFKIEFLSIPFTESNMDLAGFSWAVTLVWFVALPNLINLIDGMDGLAGGTGLFLTLTLGAVSALGGHWGISFLSFGMAGALAGFLIFNLPPAKIYLGDGGAYLIGFFVAIASTVTSYKGAVGASLTVVLITLALPLADGTFTILRRLAYGLPLFRGDNEHIHHRLLEAFGFSRRKLLAAFYASFLALSVLSLVLFLTGGHAWHIAIGGLLVLTTILLHKLNFIRRPSVLADHIKRAFRSRAKIQHALSRSHPFQFAIRENDQPWEYWSGLVNALKEVGLEVSKPTSDPAESWTQIQISLSSYGTWTLYHRTDSKSPIHWTKVAYCFVTPLFEGYQKWGQVPKAFEIEWVEENAIATPKVA